VRRVFSSLGRRTYLGCAGCRHKGYTTLSPWRTAMQPLTSTIPLQQCHANDGWSLEGGFQRLWSGFPGLEERKRQRGEQLHLMVRCLYCEESCINVPCWLAAAQALCSSDCCHGLQGTTSGGREIARCFCVRNSVGVGTEEGRTLLS
jgi:hypothetical protein